GPAPPTAPRAPRTPPPAPPDPPPRTASTPPPHPGGGAHIRRPRWSCPHPLVRTTPQPAARPVPGLEPAGHPGPSAVLPAQPGQQAVAPAAPAVPPPPVAAGRSACQSPCLPDRLRPIRGPGPISRVRLLLRPTRPRRTRRRHVPVDHPGRETPV